LIAKPPTSNDSEASPVTINQVKEHETTSNAAHSKQIAGNRHFSRAGNAADSPEKDDTPAGESKAVSSSKSEALPVGQDRPIL